MPKFSSSSLGRGFKKPASIADISSSSDSAYESTADEDAGSFSFSSPSPPPSESPHLPPSPFRSPPTLHPPPGPSPLATVSPIIASSSLPSIIASSPLPKPGPGSGRSKRFRFFSLSKRHSSLRAVHGFGSQDQDLANDGATPPPNTPQPGTPCTEGRKADKFKSPGSGSMRIPIAGLFRRATATGHDRRSGRHGGRAGDIVRPGTPIPTTPTSTPSPRTRTQTRRRYTLHGFGRSPSDYDGMSFESEPESEDDDDDDEDNDVEVPVLMEKTVSHIQPSQHARFAKVMSPVLAALKGKLDDPSSTSAYCDTSDPNHEDRANPKRKCSSAASSTPSRTTYELIDPFDPILTSVQANNLALHLIENSQSSAGSSVILLLPSRFSGSGWGSGSTSGSGFGSGSASGLPTPPIILSAPTPPHALRIASSESYIIRSGVQDVPSPSRTRTRTSRTRTCTMEGKMFTDTFQVDSVPSRSPIPSNSTSNPNPNSDSKAALKQTRGDLFAIAHTLQSAARQVESDPSFNQRTLFRSVAPIVAFLYALAVGVLVPRYMSRYALTVDASMSMSMSAVSFNPVDSPFGTTSTSHTHTDAHTNTYSTLTILLLTTLGLILLLTFTRLVIWSISLIGQSFCGMDVEEALKTGECVDTKGRKVSQADLLVGGILGM